MSSLHASLARSLEMREEALRIKEMALRREEEALARAQEANRQQSTGDGGGGGGGGGGGTGYIRKTSQIIGVAHQKLSPEAPAWGGVGQGTDMPPLRPSRLPPMEDAKLRLPPMEIETTQSPAVPRHGRSAENPSHDAHHEYGLDNEASSPSLLFNGPLSKDGSLSLFPEKKPGAAGGKTPGKGGGGGVADAIPFTSKQKKGGGTQHHHQQGNDGGPASGGTMTSICDDDGGGDEDTEKEDEGAERKITDSGDEVDTDDDGYLSSGPREKGSLGDKKRSRFPKMPKTVPKVHVTRPTVKVHKLNEMGEIVDKRGHRAWEMACGLQLGIRVMVSVNSQKSAAPEFDAFQQHVKFKFPSSGSSITPPHDGPSFKFKDYAPIIFRNLREMFSIDTADYLVALCNTRDDGSNALRIMGTPGKSGSLFFFSHDMRFIIKTLPKREAVLLREILPAYYQHVKQNPGTYLPRFYGLYRWKHEFTRKNVRFVVMNNVFATSLAIHHRFDLKGSTLGRHASQSERSKGQRAIFKDLDLLESKFKVKLGPHRKKAVLDQIRCDCHLLMSLKIMDFSLLLGVHDRSKEQVDTTGPVIHRTLSHGGIWAYATAQNDSSANMAGMQHGDYQDGAYNPTGIEGENADGSPTGERYFMGIIDILMLYTRRKKLERVWKTLAGGEGGQGVSSQPPPKYAIRFCNFLDSAME